MAETGVQQQEICRKQFNTIFPSLHRAISSQTTTLAKCCQPCRQEREGDGGLNVIFASTIGGRQV